MQATENTSIIPTPVVNQPVDIHTPFVENKELETKTNSLIFDIQCRSDYQYKTPDDQTTDQTNPDVIQNKLTPEEKKHFDESASVVHEWYHGHGFSNIASSRAYINNTEKYMVLNFYLTSERNILNWVPGNKQPLLYNNNKCTPTRIDAVVSIIENKVVHPYIPRDSSIHHSVEDNEKGEIIPCIDPTIEFIHKTLKKSHNKNLTTCNIVFHCRAGINRSATLLIGVLMKLWNKSYPSVFDIVKTQRHFINPIPAFLMQLIKVEKDLLAKHPNLAKKFEAEHITSLENLAQQTKTRARYAEELSLDNSKRLKIQEDDLTNLQSQLTNLQSQTEKHITSAQKRDEEITKNMQIQQLHLNQLVQLAQLNQLSYQAQMIQQEKQKQSKTNIFQNFALFAITAMSVFKYMYP